jgi:hypothetical protein
MSSSRTVACGGGKEKTSWPEVVGLSPDEAKTIILKDMPDAQIIVQPVGSAITHDLRFDRVRIFSITVDGVIKVADTPCVA